MCYEKNSTEGFKMNFIQKSSFVLLILASQVYGVTLEEMNHYIEASSHPTHKQMVICEREVEFIKKNPQECLKSVDMLLADKKKVTDKTTLRFEYFGGDTSMLIAANPDLENITDKEYIDKFIAQSYFNAGAIYSNLKEASMEVQMYQKVFKYEPNYKSAHCNLGLSYYYGSGVESNKIKAYEHWKIAAKQGHAGAQHNLDFLCKESPWACK